MAEVRGAMTNMSETCEKILSVSFGTVFQSVTMPSTPPVPASVGASVTNSSPAVPMIECSPIVPETKASTGSEDL